MESSTAGDTLLLPVCQGGQVGPLAIRCRGAEPLGKPGLLRGACGHAREHAREHLRGGTENPPVLRSCGVSADSSSRLMLVRTCLRCRRFGRNVQWAPVWGSRCLNRWPARGLAPWRKM